MADALFYDPAGPLECKVTDIPRLKTIDCGQGRSHVISGQVVGVHIRRHCVVDGMFRTHRRAAGDARRHDDYGVIECFLVMPARCSTNSRP